MEKQFVTCMDCIYRKMCFKRQNDDWDDFEKQNLKTGYHCLSFENKDNYIIKREDF